MSIGVRFYKDDSSIQLDTDIGEYSYLATIEREVDDDPKNTIVHAISSRYYPLLAVKNGTGAIVDVKKTGDIYTEIEIAVRADLSEGFSKVSYRIYTAGWIPDKSKWGLAIYNEQGELKYDSQYPVLNLTQTIELDDAVSLGFAYVQSTVMVIYYTKNFPKPTKFKVGYNDQRFYYHGLTGLRADIVEYNEKALVNGCWAIVNGAYTLDKIRNKPSYALEFPGVGCYGGLKGRGDYPPPRGRTRGTPLIGISGNTIITGYHFALIKYSKYAHYPLYIPSEPMMMAGAGGFNLGLKGTVLLVKD
ncbi:hypothetical protein [Endozoicomonas sp. Mp262]|uniref:hypothetical protein n=1 Tax=Endozoicomonas sp. Mp262 TaxID=2919499 RepID=UPI0021D8B8E9